MKTKDYSINKLSEITGCDRRTIKKRLASVKPSREMSGVKYYSASDVLPLVKEIPSELSEKRALEIRKLKGQCRELDFDFQIKAGQFISVAEVKRAFVQMVLVAKSKLLTIPANAAPFLVGKDMPTIADELKRQIHAALRELEHHKWNDQPDQPANEPATSD